MHLSSERQFEVVKMRCRGYSIREISQMLGICEASVKERIRRAKENGEIIAARAKKRSPKVYFLSELCS